MIKFETPTVEISRYHVCLYCGGMTGANRITGMPHCCDRAQADYDEWAKTQDWITECLQAGCVCLSVIDGTCTECGAKEE